MEMSSETANKYFQGKENIAMAIARRRIKTGGDVKAALALIPITKPVYALFTGRRRSGVPAPARLTWPRRQPTTAEVARRAGVTPGDAEALGRAGHRPLDADGGLDARRGRPRAGRRRGCASAGTRSRDIREATEAGPAGVRLRRGPAARERGRHPARRRPHATPASSPR